MYNSTQKNLLVAQEYSTQLEKRLTIAYNGDEHRDEPQLRPHLRQLMERARKLAHDINLVRDAYEEGEAGSLRLEKSADVGEAGAHGPCLPLLAAAHEAEQLDKQLDE